MSVDPIALVGLACHFPADCRDPESYWRFLESGGDAITSLSPSRSGAEAEPAVPGGFLRGSFPWGFDAEFFGLSSREATELDPQQRLLLECSWKAIEDAGWPAARIAGAAIGTYIGISATDFQALTLWNGGASRDVHTATGAALAPAAGRIAYWFGWDGPAIAVDTACSSSLVAFHLACQAIRSGECEAALAGGVNLLLRPDPFECLSRMGLLAPDGRCKSFDASANGYVRGEGCGIAVLKKLTTAVRDGDRILAVCRGSAVNQNGGGASLIAPSSAAQEKMIRQALERAGLSAADVDYVEAHGTGTPAGDAAELEALARVYGQGRATGRPLRAGSVKTNIGHLEAAAGIAGLIKAVQCLRHGRIPPQLHLANGTQTPTGIELPTKVTPWPRREHARYAAVSSFGFGGTNAHVILEEAPAPDRPDRPVERPRVFVLPISARTRAALSELVRLYRERLLEPGADPAAICYTAAVGRNHFTERTAVVGSTALELARALEARPALHAVNDAANLYCSGADVDWKAFYGDWRCERVSLPAYPFQHQAYRPDVSRPEAQEVRQDLDRLAKALEDGRTSVLDVVNETIRGVLSDEPIGRLDDDLPLIEQGITSLSGAELRARLEAIVKTPIPATVLYNYPSIRHIAAYVEQSRSCACSADETEPQAATGSFDFLDDLEPDQVAALIEEDLNRS